MLVIIIDPDTVFQIQKERYGSCYGEKLIAHGQKMLAKVAGESSMCGPTPKARMYVLESVL